MKERNIRARFAMVLTPDEQMRISMKNQEGIEDVTVDLHKLTCNEAKRLVKNIIALIRTAFRMILIHGFNHGTAIRDMVRTQDISDRIVKIELVPKNDGETVFDIAGMYA